MTRREWLVVLKVRAALTPDLLSPKWRALATPGEPLSGHCYVAAEAAFHALGGAAAYLPYVLTHARWPAGLDPGETHWFLRGPNGIVDPTALQFKSSIAYEAARPCGFLTSRPSKRARIVLSRCGY